MSIARAHRYMHICLFMLGICCIASVLWTPVAHADSTQSQTSTSTQHIVTAYAAVPSTSTADISTLTTDVSLHAAVPSTSAASTTQVAVSTSSAVDYESWTALIDALITQLQHAQTEYQSGDYAGAASSIRSAYNIQYVASNAATAIQQTLDMQHVQSDTALFRQAQMQARTSGNTEALHNTLTQLIEQLQASAQTLDSNAQLAKPKAFAQQQDEQIQQDRKALDAAKVHHNDGKGTRTWSDIAQEMNSILDTALATAQQGDGNSGAAGVNNAYYQYYEKLGFEKNVMNAISGSRVSLVESTFKEARKAMNAGDMQQARSHIKALQQMLTEDAQQLDSGTHTHTNGFTAWVTSSFGQAFLILIREGLEALLVVTAIVAYLVKTSNRKLIRWIYLGVGIGLLGAGGVAVLFMQLFGGSGPEQEILEGICALVAMVMLLYTSNWMLSKSSSKAWNAYIQQKAQTAVEQVQHHAQHGTISCAGIVSLATLSFLAVFREGAETVIFYESIYSMTQDSMGMWAGGIAASIVLLAIFAILRFTSIRIPIGPFFTVTSVLLAVLVVVFAGGGIHALIEGDVLPGIYLSSVPTSDWLGLYPYAETLIAQAIAAIAVIVLFIVGTRTSSVVRITSSSTRATSQEHKRFSK